MNNIDSNTGEIVMYQPDETIRLEVRVENDTVWLTQQQIADLFQSSRTNVVEHVIFSMQNGFHDAKIHHFNDSCKFYTI